jgi:hypothetical protein
MIKKEARVVKRKGKFCVISHHHKNKDGKYKSFGCYDTKEEAKKRLQQISAFKYKKALFLNIMTTIADDLNEKGIIHIADALINCAESLVTENLISTLPVKLNKISNLLEKKGESLLAEQVDALIPEFVELEKNAQEEEIILDEINSDISIEKISKMVKMLREQYKTGMINEEDFEYKKMLELEDLLKI